MKLSAEQFAELSSSFNAEASPSRHERRRASRMSLHARVSVEPLGDGKRLEAITVVVSDFSARGIAFIDSRRRRTGEQFVLTLPRRAGGSVTLLCTVAHVQQTGPSNWRIGAEFTCTLQPTDPLPDNPDEQKRIGESMFD